MIFKNESSKWGMDHHPHSTQPISAGSWWTSQTQQMPSYKGQKPFLRCHSHHGLYSFINQCCKWGILESKGFPIKCFTAGVVSNTRTKLLSSPFTLFTLPSFELVYNSQSTLHSGWTPLFTCSILLAICPPFLRIQRFLKTTNRFHNPWLWERLPPCASY